MKEIPIPSHHFTKLNEDIVRPCPPSQGFRYLLTTMDLNTKWVEAIELEDISSTTLVDKFLKVWILGYVCWVIVIADRGTKFTGDVWQQMCSQLHISHRTSTVYHPQ